LLTKKVQPRKKLKEAHIITTLKKKGNGPTCENYKEINLLNTSHEIYTKIITARIQQNY
jgi:hypothetical protein